VKFYPCTRPELFWISECKGTENIKAHRSSSAAANAIFATTEKTKGFSPLGKNPYIKTSIFFR